MFDCKKEDIMKTLGVPMGTSAKSISTQFWAENAYDTRPDRAEKAIEKLDRMTISKQTMTDKKINDIRSKSINVYCWTITANCILAGFKENPMSNFRASINAIYVDDDGVIYASTMQGSFKLERRMSASEMQSCTNMLNEIINEMDCDFPISFKDLTYMREYDRYLEKKTDANLREMKKLLKR